MAATRTALKEYFKKYATPTEEQFAALIDAFVHKDEDSLTQSKIDGLTAALESKVSSSDLASAVATAVAETLQGGDIEVTPAAHQHAVSDISGLGDRLNTLETSKADYEAFKTLVTAFLNDADVSDTTINRWKELEDFLSGITDSDTLSGMLQALKAEILAEVPQPQTGNYLEQVTDMAAALQTAEVGKIVQYVGQSDAEYTRGLCYEKVFLEKETTIFNEIEYNDGNTYQLYLRQNFCDLNGNKKKIYGPSSQFLSNHSEWAYLLSDFSGLTIPASENPIGKELYLWRYRNEAYPTKCYSVEYSGENPVEIGSGYTYPKFSETPYARIVEYDFEMKNGVAYVNGEPCSNTPQSDVSTTGGVPKANTYGVAIGENNQIFFAMVVAPSNDSMDKGDVYLLRTALMIPILAPDDPSAPNIEADITKTYLYFSDAQNETKTVSDYIVCQLSQETIQVPTWQPIATSPVVS